MDWITQFEAPLRLGTFLSVLIIMIAAEQVIPERKQHHLPKPFKRRASNLSLTLINTLMLRLLPGASAITAAGMALHYEWGLLHTLKPGPGLSILFSILILDAGIYFQHLAFHHFPPLWRIHRVHHCDPELDATTALRFHPLEILPSAIYKFALTLLIGAPVEAVILFEILLNASAIFNHANIRLPEKFDKSIRQIIVTPNMHSSHHSPIKRFTNSNYGFFLSIWDRVFGTYTPYNKQSNQIGLSEFEHTESDALLTLLSIPLKNKGSDSH